MTNPTGLLEIYFRALLRYLVESCTKCGGHGSYLCADGQGNCPACRPIREILGIELAYPHLAEGEYNR